MQKVPILPTTPWQGGDPKFSNPSVTVVTPTVGLHIYVARSNRARIMAQARLHTPRILTPTTKIQARRALVITRPVRANKRLKLRRHRALVIRPVGIVLRSVRQVRITIVRSRPRQLLERHVAIILRAPITPTPFVTQETLKHVYVTSRVMARKVLSLSAARREPFITRPPWTGVPRTKTVKAVYLHAVGKTEQLAKRRRHRASILKAGLLVTTPTGRISLHQVDRSKSAKLRKARLAYIFRSRGGVATVTTAKTLLAIYVHPVTASVKAKATHRRHRALVARSNIIGVRREKTLKAVFLHQTSPSSRLAARFRRHKARVSRAPIVVKRGTVLTHAVHPSRMQKARRHRVIVWRSRETVWHRRTTRPVVIRVLRKRHLAWHRRHFAKILRSLGGQSVTEVIFIEPFDQPTPTGRTGSLPTHTDYDYPGPLGRTSSSPNEGAFDIPAPIGVVSIPDPEV